MNESEEVDAARGERERAWARYVQLQDLEFLIGEAVSQARELATETTIRFRHLTGQYSASGIE